jgi:lysophospholipase L1-like esterase
MFQPKLIQFMQALNAAHRLFLSFAATCAILIGQAARAQSRPAAPATHKPALFLIGDSTIRNGSFDNGATAGQFGWGHMMKYYFDTTRIYVVNDAMGGTTSRSYQTSPNLWPIVLPKIQPGDYVLLDFGHNDSGSSLRGNGDETQLLPPRNRGGARRPGAPATTTAAAAAVVATSTAPAPGGELAHSYGWYMRQYIEPIKAKGATPIVISLIPRNRWTDGRVNRNTNDYALWARQAAEQEKVEFIPLNDLIADEYDKLGMEKVQSELFPPHEAVHPNWAGAALNAKLVVQAIRNLPNSNLKDYLVETPQVPATPDVTPPDHGDPGPAGRLPDRPDLPATSPTE